MKIYFITTNRNKHKEVIEIFGPGENLVIEQLEMKYPEVQADSLQKVAEFAAEWLMGQPDKWSNADYVMFEDSGLFIERLKGFPGVYSAYVQQTLGNRAVLELLEGEWDRRAYFETCACLLDHEANVKIFTGRCDGTISKDARGKLGFGYDPIFIPEGEIRTFAEMSTEEKNLYSHRAKAINALKEYLEEKYIA